MVQADPWTRLVPAPRRSAHGSGSVCQLGARPAASRPSGAGEGRPCVTHRRPHPHHAVAVAGAVPAGGALGPAALPAAAALWFWGAAAPLSRGVAVAAGAAARVVAPVVPES